MLDSSCELNQINISCSLSGAIQDCQNRGLLQSTKWLSELNYALRDVKVPSKAAPNPQPLNPLYLLCKSYFDLKEYDRCAYFSTDLVYNVEEQEKLSSEDVHLIKFLHYYSKYLSIEKKKLDDLVDSTSTPDGKFSASLHSLCMELKEMNIQNKLDGYGLYLYGVVLKKLQLNKDAIDILCAATFKTPLHWGVWLELAELISNRSQWKSLSLPDHWMKQFFLAKVYMGLTMHDEAEGIYNTMREQGLANSYYVLTQLGVLRHDKREVDSAIECFKEVRAYDPYCLEHMDTYSNLLYIKEMKVELSYLAHAAVDIDKYRVETCCIIGNYYSLRSDHQKAVLYFQRALKLNPNYLGVWTLLGHEYMEMKNTNAAIQCYRQAIEINSLDYRAWYGLGQTYEILRLPYYGLYYYKQAHMVRPNDPRMLTALGEAFEKQEKISEAMKCYNKSRAIGDADGKALFKLAKLYDKLNEPEAAAELFMEFVTKLDGFASPPDKTCGFFAFKYLANHHLKANNLDTAYKCAQKCLQHEETAEEAKSLLRSIAQKRMPDEGSSSQLMMECAVVLDPVPATTRSNKFPVNPAYPFAGSDPDDDAFS